MARHWPVTNSNWFFAIAELAARRREFALYFRPFKEADMESEIARLLKEFEDGRMTRRQLIRSLAMAAMAAPAAATLGAQSAPVEKAPWKTVWLDHISYQVSDYQKSAAFYTSLMGWEVRNDNGKTQATLDIGNIGQIIIRNRPQREGQQTTAPAQGAQAPATAAGQSGRPRPPLTGVINHISFGVEPWDTDKVKAELERRGLNPRPDMVGNNFKSFHVFDPDGWDLQISNQTKNG
jgi:catechol 2,3-dioxygenase-like lactoylglutathione lyase family enzyme